MPLGLMGPMAPNPYNEKKSLIVSETDHYYVVIEKKFFGLIKSERHIPKYHPLYLATVVMR
jgi:hypothetical protein